MKAKQATHSGSSKKVNIDFQSLFEAAPGLFLVLQPNSPDFTIIGVSNAYLKATMTKRAAILHKKLFKVFPDNPNDRDATGTSNLGASLDRVLKTKKPDTMAVQKYDIPVGDGKFEERYWSPLNTPVLNEKGEVTYIIHRVEDVTEFIRLKQKGKRQSEEAAGLRSKTSEMEAEIYRRAQAIQTINKELETANDQLSKLDELKTQFFTNISHEFRTPLTLMIGPLESILNDDDHRLFSAHRESLELAYQNTLRLEKLVNSLLDFSRLEAGKTSAVYQPTDLSQVTYELSSNFESAVQSAGLAYSVDCEPMDTPVYIDTGFWEKIVLNLLSNALKYTMKGHISVRVSKGDGFAQLQVSDSGIGIPKQELPHIFERFYRVKDAQSRSHEGSGIGLALVQDLVKLHGGQITAESTKGKGTTFTVRIPFGKKHLPKNQLSEVAGSVESKDYFREALSYETTRWEQDGVSEYVEPKQAVATILVVDDNSDMRFYIKSILGKNDEWRVVTASDGRSALHLVDEIAPDIILSDIMMSQMDGYELVNRLRAKPAAKDTPIIFLSARAGQEAKAEGMAAGVDDYLIKPFSAQELTSRVTAHLKLALERKHAHSEELKKLWQLNASKDEFISLASHQLRTPATVVKQYIGMLQQGYLGKMPPKQFHAIERAYASNERQLKIIDDLLMVAKIDAGMLTLQRSPTDLAQLLIDIIDEQSERILQHNQTVNFKPPKNVPSAMVDATLVRMIVENLLDNASKYSPDGKRIFLSLDYDPKDVTITVRDEGVGIRKKDMPKLFQKFSRLQNPLSAGVGGTGIGLYWVKKALEFQGGDIQVSSKLGNGSSFVVSLPQH